MLQNFVTCLNTCNNACFEKLLVLFFIKMKIIIEQFIFIFCQAEPYLQLFMITYLIQENKKLNIYFAYYPNLVLFQYI